MIIAFAFGIIGAILVLANGKQLRNKKVLFAAYFIASVFAATGIYFILHAPKDMDSRLLFPIFSPLTTMLLFHLTRTIYRSKMKMEIIMHLHGLIPARQEERYVTRLEKNITFILLILSVIVPYFLLRLIL